MLPFGGHSLPETEGVVPKPRSWTLSGGRTPILGRGPVPSLVGHRKMAQPTPVLPTHPLSQPAGSAAWEVQLPKMGGHGVWSAGRGHRAVLMLRPCGQPTRAVDPPTQPPCSRQQACWASPDAWLWKPSHLWVNGEVLPGQRGLPLLRGGAQHPVGPPTGRHLWRREGRLTPQGLPPSSMWGRVGWVSPMSLAHRPRGGITFPAGFISQGRVGWPRPLGSSDVMASQT